MKKILMCIFTFIFLFVSLTSGMESEERFNNSANMRVSRKISQIDGVMEVAVLSRRGKALIGIRLDKDAETDMVRKGAMLAADSELFGIRKRQVEIETDKALDIIELSYCIGTDVKKRALIKRFNQLART